MFDNIKNTLQPLEYYVSSRGHTKVSADYIKTTFLAHLNTMRKVYNIPSVCTNETAARALILLLENVPAASSKKETVRYDETAASMMYYSGIISADKKRAVRQYNICGLDKSNGYMLIVSCLLRLGDELQSPNTVTPFEDFPEHLLATYNILCYYCLKTKNYTLAEKSCTVLYVHTQNFLEQINLLG